MRIKNTSRPVGISGNQTEAVQNETSPNTGVQQALNVRATSGEAQPADANGPVAQTPYLPADDYRLILSQLNRAYVAVHTAGNPFALLLNSRQFKNLIWARAKKSGTQVRRWEIEEIVDQWTAEAELTGKITNVWYRIAPLPCGGFEIDLGDSAHTRVRVTAGEVLTMTSGSDVVFYRPPTTLALPLPADAGNLDLLRDKVNLADADYWLLIGWLSYTMAHAKTRSSKYVILVVHGDQGSGKTFLCSQVILGLMDPGQLGPQVFPHNGKDLAIMAEHAHVLVFDNMRAFRAAMSDVLCMTSTGGTLSNRALYSNGDLHTHNIHGAVVLNGIHHLLTQPDFGERCLTVHMKPMPADRRKSEAAMIMELERDKPAIFRGLLDLTARILAELPNAMVEHPQRMLDFVRWLAAMERVLGLPGPVLQAQYADTLNEAQRDSLLDNVLGNAIVEFASELEKEWTGTPSRLLTDLNAQFYSGPPSSREWPSNPIALSKRLNALKASLRTQGITVDITRGKERKITIRAEGASDE